MSRSKNVPFVLGYILVILGTYLFSKGFMTSRPVSETKSDTSFNIPPPFDLGPENLKGTKKKFVILILDALRIDFALPPKNPKIDLAYANKLKVMYELARDQPLQAKLYNFVADPPTATTQRLGGITGGTLPSFVEAFQNFAGETLLSDNIVYQLLNDIRYKDFHFMGDDTWIHLFPFILEKTSGQVKGYHSFHLFDLHTVDNGCKEQLFITLKEGNFDVIVSHFLGLDHCGHKYGPLNQECGAKLQEYDAIIRQAIDNMPDDATLIVFGDHGMTEEGDHGGNTPKEVSSALFVYNKRPSQTFDPSQMKKLENQFKVARNEDGLVEKFYQADFDDHALSGVVSQVDFAATFSTLADIPVPFGNLGSLIPDALFALFPDRLSCLKNITFYLKRNAMQMKNYFTTLESYQSDFKRFEPHINDADAELQKFLKKGGSEFLEAASLAYYRYMQEALIHCRDIWSKYDFVKIYFGLFLMLLGLAVIVHHVCRQSSGVSIIPLLGTLSIFLISQCLGKATNSFIIFEDSIVRYALLSLIFGVCFWQKRADKFVIIGAIIRVFGVFKACREEHGKHCCPCNHRTVPVNSSNGRLLLLMAILSGSNRLALTTENFSYWLLTAYQLYGWINESFKLNEWILQVAFPRLIFGACLISCFLTRKDKLASRKGLFYLSILLAVVQRPFGGWVITNAVSHLVPYLNGLMDYDSILRPIIFYYLGLCLFFWTSHHAVISNVHWEAGFTGFSDLNQFRAGILLCLNTFAGPLLGSLCTIFTPSDSSGMFDFKVLIMVSVIELFFESLFLTFLLRHLMLWTVFTPRFIMQAAIVGLNFALFVIASIFR